MTLKQWPFDSQPDGTVATAANTGATWINAAGGTITFSTAAAHNGSTGLRFASSAGGTYTAGAFDTDATNNIMALSMVFALPALPSSDAGILVTHGGSGPTFVIQADGTVVWNKGGYQHPTVDYQITPGQQYRIAAQINASGTLNSKLFTADGSTALATWDLSGLSMTGPFEGLQVGTLNSNPGLVILADDLQADDGRTTEIPGLTSQPKSPVHITSVTDNSNNWAANTGTIVNALNDDSRATWVDGDGALSGSIGYLADGPVTLIPDADNTGGAASLKVELFQGSTSVASHTWDLSGTLTPYQLSSAENAAISDRSDLNVTVTFS